MENCFYRALRNTCFAVDAFFWVDVKHGLAFVETLYGANHNAVSISAAITRLGHDMSHTGVLRNDK